MRDEDALPVRFEQPCSIDTHIDANGAPTLVLKGEVDLMAADEVLAAIAAAVSIDGTGVVVDLRGVTFMDSSGLRTILLASQDAARRGGGMVARVEDGPVARLFELTGVREMLDVRGA